MKRAIVLWIKNAITLSCKRCRIQKCFYYVNVIVLLNNAIIVSWKMASFYHPTCRRSVMKKPSWHMLLFGPNMLRSDQSVKVGLKMQNSWTRSRIIKQASRRDWEPSKPILTPKLSKFMFLNFHRWIFCSRREYEDSDIPDVRFIKSSSVDHPPFNSTKPPSKVVKHNID